MIDQGRSLGAVAGNLIVATVRRSHRIHCSNRDYVRTVSRRRGGSVAIGPRGIVATLIACCHYNSRLPRLLDRLAERIARAGAGDSPAQREIDDPNVIRVLELDGSL